MEVISLPKASFESEVQRATDILAHAGVIVFPTDTLYGLGADAFDDEAVDRVYRIKGRDEKKPIHCIVADMEMAARYAEVSDDARLLAKAFFPGPLTLILKKREEWSHGIGRNLDTIGMRIPRNDFCTALARSFGRPFTATSANRSGEAPHRTIEAIEVQLRDVANEISLAFDAGTLAASKPSTVVDLSGEEPVILREGAIEVADIWNTIRAEP